MPGTIVRSTDSTQWDPDSPDPAGITYLPDSGKLLVSDSEVEELPALYQGVNLWTSTLTGQGTASGTTLPVGDDWSNEPTGVAYDSGTKRLFVSDDVERKVFEIASAGADGAFGTADDGARSSFKVSTFGATDSEDVAYDSKRNELLVIDGVGMELYRISPGADQKFATSADNVVTHTDVEHLGVIDPEAVGYDPVRDTVLVADDQDIFELDSNGSLIDVIDMPTTDVFAISGIAVAPASSGTGLSYYVTDRGKDNNEVPGENDGRLLEVSATLPAISNRPPHVSAGADQVVQLPAAAQLSGTASDDGKPAPLSYTWTTTSGPGTATFSAPHALQTAASFPVAGTYVLRLTATDSQLSDYDELTVSVYQPGQTRTVSLPITASTDDAQEGGGEQGNSVDIEKPDVELGNDGTIDPYSQQLTNVLTGLRFASVPVPAGGRVVSAKIQFTTDEATTDTTPASFSIRGEAADDAATYAAVRGNISGRTATTATVAWSPPAWNEVKAAGAGQQTPDLTSIVQQVVDRAGWKQGNAIAFMISGTGRRTAGAYDGLVPAPVLTLQYQAANTAPAVDAGVDQAIQLPASANLKGVVTDDNLPSPPATTTTSWTKLSGPGTVIFADPAAPSTTVTFDQPGSYVLQLTGSDGLLTGSDTVTIAVEQADAPPVVDAGNDQVVKLPGSATLAGAVLDPGYPGTMAAVTTTWSLVSGPGTVTFGSTDAASTSATFSEPGSYELRLTGHNGSILAGTDDVLIDVQPADLSVSMQSSTHNLVAGKRLTLRGLLTRTADGVAAAGHQVEVLAYAAPRYRERALGTLTVADDGSFSLTDRPNTTTRYVARTEQGETVTVVVKVRPRLTGKFTRSTVRRHRNTYVHGYVSPSASGQRLLLQRRSHGHWVTVARKTMHAADRAGYRFRVREHRAGRYHYRVVAPAYRGRAQAVTRSLRLVVRR